MARSASSPTALDESLAAGERHVVLDNTYLTRAARSFVVEAAERHGLAARCLWLDTPLAQAQVNLVERFLEVLGSLPSPEELRARAREPGLVAPTSQMRALRELEEPDLDEGFATVERIPFAREPAAGRKGAGVLVAAAALDRPGWEVALDGCDPDAPHLLFDWRPGGAVDLLDEPAARLADRIRSGVEHRALSASGRAAGLLVPPAAPGPRRRVRGAARRRPHAVDGGGHEPCAPHARDRARRTRSPRLTPRPCGRPLSSSRQTPPAG